MDFKIGKTHWAIPEGYIPSKSNGPEPAMESHDSGCLLHTSDKEAKVEIFTYFEDKDPVGPFKVTVRPQRTVHV